MAFRRLLIAAIGAAVALSGCTGTTGSGDVSVVPKGVFEADLDTISGVTAEQRDLLHRNVKAMELAFDGKSRGAAILWLRGHAPRVTKIQVAAAQLHPGAAGFEAVLTSGQRFHMINQGGQVLVCTNCARYQSPSRWTRKDVRLP